MAVRTKKIVISCQSPGCSDSFRHLVSLFSNEPQDRIFTVHGKTLCYFHALAEVSEAAYDALRGNDDV